VAASRTYYYASSSTLIHSHCIWRGSISMKPQQQHHLVVNQQLTTAHLILDYRLLLLACLLAYAHQSQTDSENFQATFFFFCLLLAGWLAASNEILAAVAD